MNEVEYIGKSSDILVILYLFVSHVYFPLIVFAYKVILHDMKEKILEVIH